jgi:hypothetical protein
MSHRLRVAAYGNPVLPMGKRLKPGTTIRATNTLQLRPFERIIHGARLS